jgi:predicted phage terminase large subunit-like protein
LGLTHAQHRKRILESRFYQRLFPAARIAKDGNRVLDIVTTLGGRIRTISVEGTATGLGAHFIILDDCMKPEDTRSAQLRERIKSWYEGTISTRTINERSAIISIQQRLHEDDLPAYLREKRYACLCLPARAPEDLDVDVGPGQVHLWRRNELLCPELMSEGELERKRLEHGPQVFASQFLQDPIAPGGNLIRMDQFPRFEVEMVRDDFDKVFQSWDTAASTLPTADWSVCTTWGYLAGRLFLLDILRERLEYGPLKRAVIAQRAKWRADVVIIESVGVGKSLCQELRRNGPFVPFEMRPSTDKPDRLLAQSGQIEEGRVWLPAALPGLDTLISELKAFPLGSHDDQVDTLSQILEYLMFHWRYADVPCDARGRPTTRLRMRDRPPLPPLPDWIE